MENLKNKFENKTKVRINVINYDDSGKSSLQKIIVKQGIFEGISFVNKGHITFPTEILCSSPRNNSVRVYLSIKKEDDILKELKENILRSVYEACLIFENENINQCINDNDERKEFEKAFINSLMRFGQLPLSKFYEVNNIEKIFEIIKFKELFKELKKINYITNIERLEYKDDFIWENYFNDFQVDFRKKYNKWIKRIPQYYENNQDGHEYINEDKNFTIKYFNKDFCNLCKILYGIKSSCALMIERAYIEVPSNNDKYSGSVYIHYNQGTQYRNISKIIEKRIGEDYKELFLIVAKSSNYMDYFSQFKENVNNITLNKRIFCILNEFDFYKNQSLKDKNQNNQQNLIDTLKYNVSREIGISQDKIIVTEQFKDIDKNTFMSLNTNNDLLMLLRLIKAESEKVGKVIKIKSSSKEKIISINLNQERMSVQALMGMLYERYNGYLVSLWNKLIEDQESNKINEKYYYKSVCTIIRNRKDDYKEYKHINQSNNKQIIDFSLRRGDCNNGKKILEMLVNYGYNTVGFDSNENKILVNVNGEISEEDKNNLIRSIKGRLEESAINYFENAFLMDISRKKFNTNSLYKALEIEKNITIDDFYSAFKEIFRKISENILRYEVYLQ